MDQVKSIIKELDSRTNAKKIYMGKRKSYADIVIVDKTRGAIMSKMGRYDVSVKVAVTTDRKLRT